MDGFALLVLFSAIFVPATYGQDCRVVPAEPGFHYLGAIGHTSGNESLTKDYYGLSEGTSIKIYTPLNQSTSVQLYWLSPAASVSCQTASPSPSLDSGRYVISDSVAADTDLTVAMIRLASPGLIYEIFVCNGTACPEICPGDCSNAGWCDTSTGECRCQIGFSGDDCGYCPACMGIIAAVFGSILVCFLVTVCLPCVVIACICFAVCYITTEQSRRKYARVPLDPNAQPLDRSSKPTYSPVQPEEGFSSQQTGINNPYSRNSPYAGPLYANQPSFEPEAVYRSPSRPTVSITV